MDGWLKTLCGKLALRRSVGVYIDEGEVTVTRVAFGLLGPVVEGRATAAYDADTLQEVVSRSLDAILGGRRSRRTRVSIGVPMLRVFFANREVTLSEKDASPAVLLHETLRSANVNVSDLEVDVVRAQPGKGPLAILLAGRRKYLAGLLAAVTNAGFRPLRAEPAPFALLRLAAARHKAPRRTKAVIRVFLGTSQGVAVQVSGVLAVSWRVFELRPGEEVQEIGSTIKAIEVVSRLRGSVPTAGAVMIHGRPDLAEALGAAEFSESAGVRCLTYPGPSLDAEAVSLGLALGGLEGEEALDLTRGLKPKPPFWETFPFADLAMQTAILLCATLFLDAKKAQAAHAFRQIKAEAAKHPWMAKVADDRLEKEKQELTQKIEAVRQYLESRTLWTIYTRDATVLLPEAVVLRSLAGTNELDMGRGRARGKKSLAMKITAPIAPGLQMSRELDTYITALRRDPVLQREFPVVELGDLKWNQPAIKGSVALNEFTVTCLPPVAAPRPKGGDAGKLKAAEH